MDLCGVYSTIKPGRVSATTKEGKLDHIDGRGGWRVEARGQIKPRTVLFIGQSAFTATLPPE